MASQTPSRTPSRDRSHSRSPRANSPRRSVTPRSVSRSRPGSRSPSAGGAVNNGYDRRGRRETPSRSRSPPPRRDNSRSPPPRRTSPARTAKIVVEKLTKNVNVEHLREIFGAYGAIRDVEMPMNRQFMTNRGTAYILYNDMADAETAIAHMHEAQLDGAVINVSVVLPRRKFSRSPPPSRRLAAHLDRVDRGPPARGGYGGPPPVGGRFRSPPRRRDSPPPRRYAGPERGRDNPDNWRPRSYSRSRSRSPRRSFSRSYSRSLSRSPPPRRGGGGGGGGFRRRDSPPRGGDGGGGGRRRRSPSYSSYDSYSDRSRSRSRDRGGRGGRR